MSDNIKFCQECGAKLVEGSSFCTECGNKSVSSPQSPKEDKEMKKDESFFNDLEKEKKGGISDNNKQWKPKPPKEKKEKSAAAKFFGFIFKLILFGIILYFIYMMVKTEGEKDMPDNNKEEIIDNISNEASLINVPLKIDEENGRELLNNNILVIKYLNSKISLEYEYPMLQNIFKESVIDDAESTDIYNAYNVKYEKFDYSAVVFYDIIDDEVVIDIIIVSKGKFNIATIENIMSALTEG